MNAADVSQSQPLSPISASVDPRTDSNEASEATLKSRHVTTACASCKKFKRKCDGKQPCETCVKKNRSCVFYQSEDGRRGRKRLLDELLAKANRLDNLVESLQSSDDDAVRKLARLLNEGSSNTTVPAGTENSFSGLDADTANSSLRDIDARSKRMLSIAALVDDPPIRVPAYPWTEVIDDCNAVSHLISVYFTWHHPCFPIVDQDIFIREMKEEDLSSRFCSPLLVNVCLFIACFYTDHPAVFKDANDKASRGIHFWDEAVRLWNLEEGRVTLTNLQALPQMALCSGIISKDRIGRLYSTQAGIITRDLVTKVKKSSRAGGQEFADKEFQLSYSLALWASFMIQVEMNLVWLRPLDLSRPPVQKPHLGETLNKVIEWRPYPSLHATVPEVPFGLHYQSYLLHEIGADITPAVLSGNPADSPLPGQIIFEPAIKLELAKDLARRLDRWKHSLPSYAQINVNDTGSINGNPTAGLIDLHLIYHFYVITVQNILRQIDLPEASSALDGVPSDDLRHQAAANVLLSCRSIASIFDWIQRTISFTYYSVFVVQSATTVAYNVLDDLQRSGVPDILHTVTVALFAVSRRWLIARGILKMIWITLQQRKVETLLNSNTIELLKLSAVENWGTEDHRLFESCVYPDYAVTKESGRELADMGDLLVKWSHLQLEDDSISLDNSSSSNKSRI